MVALPSECIQIEGSKKLICPGDPVKLAGRQGLYRYVKMLTEIAAEIVGPYFPNSPQRTQESTRIQVLGNLRTARGAKRADVEMSALAKALSNDAKRRK